MDEISLFVHQLLLRSSSSRPSCSSVVGPHSQHSSDHLTTPRESVIAQENELHVSSTKAGNEAIVEEVPKQEPHVPAPRNSSSKRSRAAEVHNLAEKRRRSRINEKMKALQKLIPNSNRTDKASMLDEAIEYLKQLQLQVQMLSMRNRTSLHSICLPEPLQPSNNFHSRFDPGVEKPSQNLSTMDSLAINQASRPERMSNPQKKCTLSNQLFVPDLSNVLNLKTSCGSHASFQDHIGGFPLCESSDLGSVVTPMSNFATGGSKNLATLSQCSSWEVHKEDDLPPEYFDCNHSARTLSEFGIGAIFTSSLPSEKRASNMKDCSQEASLICRGQTNVLLESSTKGNHAHFLDPDIYATKRRRLAS